MGPLDGPERVQAPVGVSPQASRLLLAEDPERGPQKHSRVLEPRAGSSGSLSYGPVPGLVACAAQFTSRGGVLGVPRGGHQGSLPESVSPPAVLRVLSRAHLSVAPWLPRIWHCALSRRPQPYPGSWVDCGRGAAGPCDCLRGVEQRCCPHGGHAHVHSCHGAWASGPSMASPALVHVW